MLQTNLLRTGPASMQSFKVFQNSTERVAYLCRPVAGTAMDAAWRLDAKWPRNKNKQNLTNSALYSTPWHNYTSSQHCTDHTETRFRSQRVAEAIGRFQVGAGVKYLAEISKQITLESQRTLQPSASLIFHTNNSKWWVQAVKLSRNCQQPAQKKQIFTNELEDRLIFTCRHHSFVKHERWTLTSPLHVEPKVP